MKKGNISPIGDVVKSVFVELDGRKNVSEEDIQQHWESLAGADGARHSRPHELKKLILTVRVDSSVWLQELTMRKRFLLKGLKRALGKDRISEIHFKIGEF